MIIKHDEKNFYIVDGRINDKLRSPVYEDELKNSESAKVIGGSMKDKNTLDGATDIQCYLNGTIKHLGNPASGTIVARKIRSYAPGNGKAIIYAAKLGISAWLLEKQRLQRGKPPRIKRISDAYFENRCVNFENLASTLDEVRHYKTSPLIYRILKR